MQHKYLSITQVSYKLQGTIVTCKNWQHDATEMHPNKSVEFVGSQSLHASLHHV